MIHSTTNRIFGRLLLAIATGAALTAALPAGAQPANRDLAVLPRIDRDHQKDRGARQFRNDRLWND